MPDEEGYYERRQLIRRSEDFADLYADTCARVEEDAPNNTSKVKFDTAIEQIGDDEMSEIRGFDRSRSGGFVNG